MPGGNDQWGVGKIVCRGGELVASGDAKYFPQSLTNSVRWSASNPAVYELESASTLQSVVPSELPSALADRSSETKYVVCLVEQKAANDSQLSLYVGMVLGNLPHLKYFMFVSCRRHY